MASRPRGAARAAAAPDAALKVSMRAGELILTLSCPDRRGIVYAVARAIADGGGNILDSQQFGDPDEGVFFMRVHFADDRGTGPDAWLAEIAPVAAEFAMRWELHEGSTPAADPRRRLSRGSLPERPAVSLAKRRHRGRGRGGGVDAAGP